MDSVYDYITLASFVMAAVFLVLSVGLFFGMHIPVVWKEINGSLVGGMNGALLKVLSRQDASGQDQNKKKISDIFGDLANYADEESEADKPTSILGIRVRKGGAGKTSLLRSNAAGTTLLSSAKVRIVMEKDVVYVATDQCL